MEELDPNSLFPELSSLVIRNFTKFLDKGLKIDSTKSNRDKFEELVHLVYNSNVWDVNHNEFTPKRVIFSAHPDKVKQFLTKLEQQNIPIPNRSQIEERSAEFWKKHGDLIRGISNQESAQIAEAIKQQAAEEGMAPNAGPLPALKRYKKEKQEEENDALEDQSTRERRESAINQSTRLIDPEIFERLVSKTTELSDVYTELHDQFQVDKGKTWKQNDSARTFFQGVQNDYTSYVQNGGAKKEGNAAMFGQVPLPTIYQAWYSVWNGQSSEEAGIALEQEWKKFQFPKGWIRMPPSSETSAPTLEQVKAALIHVPDRQPTVEEADEPGSSSGRRSGRRPGGGRSPGGGQGRSTEQRNNNPGDTAGEGRGRESNGGGGGGGGGGSDPPGRGGESGTGGNNPLRGGGGGGAPPPPPPPPPGGNSLAATDPEPSSHLTLVGQGNVSARPGASGALAVTSRGRLLTQWSSTPVTSDSIQSNHTVGGQQIVAWTQYAQRGIRAQRYYVVKIAAGQYQYRHENRCGGSAVFTKLDQNVVPKVNAGLEDIRQRAIDITVHGWGLEWVALPTEMGIEPQRLPIMVCHVWYRPDPNSENKVKLVVTRTALHKLVGERTADDYIVRCTAPTGANCETVWDVVQQRHPIAITPPTQRALLLQQRLTARLGQGTSASYQPQLPSAQSALTQPQQMISLSPHRNRQLTLTSASIQQAISDSVSAAMSRIMPDVIATVSEEMQGIMEQVDQMQITGSRSDSIDPMDVDRYIE